MNLPKKVVVVDFFLTFLNSKSSKFINVSEKEPKNQARFFATTTCHCQRNQGLKYLVCTKFQEYSLKCMHMFYNCFVYLGLVGTLFIY